MPEQSTEKRVKFNKGDQAEFLASIMKKNNITTETLAAIAKVSVRQISRWVTGKYSLPLSVVTTLSKKSGSTIPRNITIFDRYSHTHTAGRKGGRATMKLYGVVPGSETNRLSAWNKWWISSGKAKVIKASKKHVTLPNASSGLAEFTGIMMGDGGLSRHQVCVTLNKIDDFEYSMFVEKMMLDLFGVKPSRNLHSHKKAVCLVISRVDLVNYCNKHLNLPIGHKISQGLHTPSWILVNKEYSKSFIRGLLDTDGCVVIETHSVKNKRYLYARLNFTTYCRYLSNTIYSLLTDFGFHPKKRRGGKSIQLENFDEICDYFRVIGTHNPKHISRLESISR